MKPLNILTLDAICLLGLCTILVGGGLVAMRSARTEADAIARENDTRKKHLGDLSRAQSVQDSLRAALLRNEGALETLKKRLPASAEIGSFLEALDALARNNGVNLNRVEPNPVLDEAICTRTPVEFSCTGKFESLHAVLYGLVNMDRLVRVNQLSIRRGALSSDCRMDAVCSVYGRCRQSQDHE